MEEDPSRRIFSFSSADREYLGKDINEEHSFDEATQLYMKACSRLAELQASTMATEHFQGARRNDLLSWAHHGVICLDTIKAQLETHLPHISDEDAKKLLEGPST